MFDVLVYLFENYYQTETYPDQDTLERKLHAAGFENDDIQDALDWLNILTDLPKEGLPESLDARPSFRGYSETKQPSCPWKAGGSLLFSKAQKYSPRCCANSSSSAGWRCPVMSSAWTSSR